MSKENAVASVKIVTLFGEENDKIYCVCPINY